MSMRNTTLAPRQLLHSVHMEKSYLGRWVTTGNPPLEVVPGQQKTHVNSYRCQTMQWGKVDPRVSVLTMGNELSQAMQTDPKGLFTWTRDSELPRGNDCLGASITLRSHDNLLSQGNIVPSQLHCLGTSSSKSDHYKVIWIPSVLTRSVTQNEFYTCLPISGVFWCTEAKFTPGSVSCLRAMSCPGIMWTGLKIYRFEYTMLPVSCSTAMSCPGIMWTGPKIYHFEYTMLQM